MGAPLNNKNAVGNSGGKTLHIQKQRAEYLDKVFFGDMDIKELDQKIKGGRYSVFNKMVYKALKGNDRMSEAMWKKAMPDNINLSVKEKVSDILNKEEQITIALKGQKLRYDEIKALYASNTIYKGYRVIGS